MGKRRRNLFVLLFVFGLIVVSGIVIANKPTKLGLDLKGGVQLVLQGRPTPQQPTLDNGSMEKAVDIIRSGCDQLGVSEIEVARVGSDQIQVGIPGATSVGKATECATKPARLFFFDWEPNLIGREFLIGGHPGKEPPEGPIKDATKEWQEAGRLPTKKENQQLIVAGAFPTEYAAVKLASEQKPKPACPKCSSSATYYLFANDKEHKLIDGPEYTKGDLFISPSGRKRPENVGTVIKVPQGTIVVSEKPQDANGQVLENAEPGWFALKDDPALSGTEITSPKQETDESGQPNVTFKFTDSGRQNFQEVTRQIAQRGAASAIGLSSSEAAAATSGHFAVVLDNEVKTRPIINYAENPDGIDGRTGAQISGGFNSIEDAQDLASFLQRGALPINLNLISQSQVSATLGSEALHDGIRAGLIGLILTVLFLLIFYRFLGLVAVTALAAYGVIFFALVKLIPITLTLPGIAGLVLTIGVTADANIVIFERIKEEVRAGRSMSSAISAGYRRGIATIIDANVVTLLTAFVLFVLATAGVKGFAFVLGVGTIVSLLTAVVFTQALLGAMSRSRLLRSPAALGATKEGIRWHFDFMGASRWFFTVSGVILLVGALSLATKQLNLGIDFKSGTRVEVALVKQTNEEAVRETLDSTGISGGEVQKVSNPGLGDNAYLIQSKTLEPDQINKLQKELEKEYGIQADGFNSTSVGPTFGTTVANSARNALIFSLLIICAYIAFRFDPKFAVPVLIAIFHDILITAGIYSLTGREVSAGTVAAFLTILGYSLYDTIIVFDRIRENMPRMPRAAFSQIVNRSMSEVLTRSLATSFTTLLSVVCLLIFGGATLQDFAFAMMIGIISGTYSSIFIASPVLTAWKEREPGFIRRRERIVAIDGNVPAFAEDGDLAMLADDGETEVEIEEEVAAQREAQPKAGAVATVEPPSEGDGGKPSSNGEPPAVDPADAARRERDEKRRARRQQRRKHGRKR
ncbi:MAG TPA: protein translocase subunit SecD [Solirubrobacterales bacterium]|jgi:SecD/SecF fusion protein|nr:protein translocase subunit SecD [Solirubrobacterales bacterium]